MTVFEMDDLCRDLDVDSMIEAIGLDMEDFVEISYQLGKKSTPTEAASLVRIGALIGCLYARGKS